MTRTRMMRSDGSCWKRRGGEHRHRHTLPRDVERLPWLAEQLDISMATCYRLAKAGELEHRACMRLAVNTAVSTTRFYREWHGVEGGTMVADAWATDGQVSL